MLNYIQNFLIPDNLLDEDKRSEFRLIQYVIFILFIPTTVGLILDGIIHERFISLVIFGLALISLIISALLLKNGKDRFARLLVPTVVLITLTLIIWEGSGIHDTAMIALIIVIIAASLLTGTKTLLIFGALSTLVVAGLALAEVNGLLTNAFSKGTDMGDVFTVSLMFISITGLQYLLIRRLNHETIKTKIFAESQIQTNDELRELQTSLESRVEERTAELAKVNQKNERQAVQLRAIAEIARSVNNLQGLEALLPEIVQLISKSFGYYHVGIFLLDAKREFAILKAANSLGGQRMLERNHQLKIGETGIVGFVTETGQPRITLDVGDDAIFFNNPDLPDTHSEMALPLMVGNEIIGALDVQSTETAAFDSDDIETLSLLTNQISIAIQNARLFEETRAALSEAQSIYTQSALTSWREINRQGAVTGFRYANGTVEPLEDASTEGVAPSSNETLPIPIKFRGQTLGALSIRQPGRTLAWSASEIRLYQAIVDRLSFALENARLYVDAQKKASRELIIGEISSKITSSIQIETILRIAAEELSHALRDSEVLVQLQPGNPKDGKE